MTEGLHYARNGDVRLAYRVLGAAGPFLIWVPGWVMSNVDAIDEPESPYADAIDELSRSTRLIVWDRRGAGISDPSIEPPSAIERVDDVRAILDAAGAERAAFFGTSEGGSISIRFASMYPERVLSLVLYGTAGRYSQDLPGFPWGFTPAEIQAQLDEIDRNWGDGALADLFFGATAETPVVREMFGRLQRAMMSPTTAKSWWKSFMEIDVRDVLASVRTPTLVLGRPNDRLVPIDATAALAAAIPGAQFRLLPPGLHILADLIPTILEFVCGKPDERADERILKTVMFTDIVGSTERLSARGDAHWHRQLDAHDKIVGWLLEKYDAHLAKHTGDGVFALFDEPSKAVRCAVEMGADLAARGITIRAGVHIGECERRGAEWSGLAVHIGARISASAGPGEVLVSRTVRDVCTGSGLGFESLGPRRLKGLPEEVEVYRVTNDLTP